MAGAMVAGMRQIAAQLGVPAAMDVLPPLAKPEKSPQRSSRFREFARIWVAWGGAMAVFLFVFGVVALARAAPIPVASGTREDDEELAVVASDCAYDEDRVTECSSDCSSECDCSSDCSSDCAGGDW